MSYLFTLTFLILLAHYGQSFEVRIAHPQHLFTPKDVADYNNLKLSVNGGDRFIYPHTKNTFNVANLVAARNMIEIVSNLYQYPILMVDKKPNTEQLIYNLIHPNTRQIIQKLQGSILISPLTRINYFQPQGGFQIKSFLFSGTGLMIIFGLFLFLCYQQLMPKLQEAQAAPA